MDNCQNCMQTCMSEQQKKASLVIEKTLTKFEPIKKYKKIKKSQDQRIMRKTDQMRYFAKHQIKKKTCSSEIKISIAIKKINLTSQFPPHSTNRKLPFSNQSRAPLTKHDSNSFGLVAPLTNHENKETRERGGNPPINTGTGRGWLGHDDIDRRKVTVKVNVGKPVFHEELEKKCAKTKQNKLERERAKKEWRIESGGK